MNAILFPRRPAVEKTVVRFDATKPLPKSIRQRLARFGLGIESETGEWVRDSQLGTWNPTLFTSGPRVEPLPKTDREATAFEAGWRVGYGRVDAKRIMSFSLWSESEIASYWLGFRRGRQQSDAQRLQEQAELDAMYDAMYAAECADAAYGYE